MTTLVADTNIFLRFLTNDVPAQADKISRRFLDAQKGKYTIYVYHFTVIEISFHLERWYKYTREDAASILIQTFSPKWIEIENKQLVTEALSVYSQVTIDFVDVLLYTLTKANKHTLLSFDKDFDHLPEKVRVAP